MLEPGTAAPKGNYESKLSTEPSVYCSALEEMSASGQPSGESYLWTNDFIAAILRNLQTTGSQPQKENAPDVPSRKKHLVLQHRDRNMWPPHFSTKWFSSTVARKTDTNGSLFLLSELWVGGIKSKSRHKLKHLHEPLKEKVQLILALYVLLWLGEEEIWVNTGKGVIPVRVHSVKTVHTVGTKWTYFTKN